MAVVSLYPGVVVTEKMLNLMKDPKEFEEKVCLDGVPITAQYNGKGSVAEGLNHVCDGGESFT